MYGNKLRLLLALLCALQCWIAFPAFAAKVSCSGFYTGKGVQLNWSKMPTQNLTCLVGLIEDR